MYGWRGKILRVDLTKGKLTEESLDAKAAKDYIGGRGLGIRQRPVDRAHRRVGQRAKGQGSRRLPFNRHHQFHRRGAGGRRRP